MTDPETLSRDLRDDLKTLARRRGNDERFCAGLYRALSNRRLSRRGDDGGHVTLSRRLAADAVNELRTAAELPQLDLDSSGGEGELDDDVRAELEALGWRSQPADTGEHDPQHLSAVDSPPPRDAGERQAPIDRSPSAERAEAHADAETERRRKA